MAPLAIDEQWQTVTDLIVAVATEDLSDPATADRLRDRAVAATKAVDEVRLYAQHTCGVDLIVAVTAPPGHGGARSPGADHDGRGDAPTDGALTRRRRRHPGRGVR